MKFYIAARFPRKDEMRKVAEELREKLGYTPRCSWVYGGEDGLCRREIANLDLEDVRASDLMILFTHPRGTKQPGGGRFVEFGYALAKGKRCVVIGDYENVFMHTEGVEVYPDIKTFLLCESRRP